jgi:hypothetical protein
MATGVVIGLVIGFFVGLFIGSFVVAYVAVNRHTADAERLVRYVRMTGTEKEYEQFKQEMKEKGL